VPTLATLQGYQAVLTWANVGYPSNAAMGDVLADYVDAGGGVVVATFANASATLSLSGRWVSGGYESIIGGSGQTQGAATLGTVHQPAHPIMAGVTSFDGGTSSYRPTMTNLTPGSVSIADWSDGRVLVAVGANPRSVGLGFYPPSSDCRVDFWASSTDGARLMANALLFAAQAGGTCYANCDGSTTPPVLNVNDFVCFQTSFAAAEPYADCDHSTSLNVNDFVCFQTSFAAGCR
jgi:hypothetical protein